VPRKDRIVEAPMIAWWFEGIRIALNANGPYGVEKRVEPDAYQKMKSGYDHRRKWSDYKRGKHHPRLSLIEKAEKLVPGSATAFSHPIWNIGRLKPSQRISDFADAWLNQLKPDLQPLLFRVDEITGSNHRRGVTTIVLKKLVRRADLDALAALSIFLREAEESRRYKLLMEVGEALYQALLFALVFGNEQLRIVLPKIFEMLVQRVFSFARNRWSYYSFEGLDIAGFCKLFHVAVTLRMQQGGLNSGRLTPSSLESLISLGISHPNLICCFHLPARPYRQSKSSVQEERIFKECLSSWSEAIDRMVAGR